jgi:Ca-activated chloride channel family protein
MNRRAGMAWAGTLLAASACAPGQEPFQLSVNVNLVVLQATVKDRAGHFAPDLSETYFQIYEDGVRQSITLFRHEDVPVAVGLVIDHSGSMHAKLPEVVAAARSFVESSNERDQLFVVNFNDRVAVATTRDVEHAILGIPAIGMTKLYDAVFEAQGQLTGSTPDRKVLIVISDGGDNASGHSLAEVLKRAETASALIYTIGIFDADDPDRNPDALRRLARFTGGEAFFPAQLSDTVEICRQIAHDIRNQYTLGYISTNTVQNGAVRTIRVTAAAQGHGKLAVRTRSGYIPGVR